MKNIFIMLMLPALLMGCAQYQTTSEAYVSEYAKGGYEIRLDAMELVAGGPCNITFPRHISISHWLYVTEINGNIQANCLVLTYDKDKVEHPWIQSDLRGLVMFSSGRMHVELECPVYNRNSIDHYVPYPLNGDYSLKQWHCESSRDSVHSGASDK